MIKTPWSSRASPGSSARPGSTNSPRRTSCRRTWTSNDARNWSRAMPQTTDIVDVNATIAYLADELRPRLAQHPLMIGIPTGGVWIAQRLHALLGLSDPLGTLDISFYRDDFTRVGMHPQVKTSNLPVNVENPPGIPA